LASIAWGPAAAGSMCVVSQPESLIENAGEAILERKATSG